jgi:site-specific recombinase XerC
LNAQPLPALAAGDPSVWDQALYAFLVEKGNRSGSSRTVESYSRMLWPFFHGRTPDAIRPSDVLAYAHGIGLSGRAPSGTTIRARMACLSSYFRFLIRMGMVTANPCDAVERPRTFAAPARGLSADQIRRLLATVPDTEAGRRDRAIMLTFILTGRRRAEVMSLTAGDISVEDGVAFYAYRGKGGKLGRRELPAHADDIDTVVLHTSMPRSAIAIGCPRQRPRRYERRTGFKMPGLTSRRFERVAWAMPAAPPLPERCCPPYRDTRSDC